MLHIINGESTAGTLRLSSVKGEKFSFREVLILGPARYGIEAAEWRQLRVKHLSEQYDLDPQKCEAELLEQEELLNNIDQHDEVVLWFEHDLFCQLNLLFLLHRLANAAVGNTRLSLINIGAYPSKLDFRGLGELNPDELASLFPARELLAPSQLRLGDSAWQAYCSSDPTAIENLLQTDTTALPFLETALRAHLKRFPSVRNGLGRVEARGLELISDGPQRFVDIFPKFADTERVYGLGDAQFWNSLKRMAKAQEPLVSVKAFENISEFDPLKINLEITDTGRVVLKGEADFVSLNGTDYWLGGVRLAGREHIWRWHDQAEKLVMT